MKKYLILCGLLLPILVLFSGCTQITPEQAEVAIEGHPYLSFLVNVDYSMTDNYALQGLMKQPGLPKGKALWYEFAMVTSDGWHRYLMQSPWGNTYIFKKGQVAEMYSCNHSSSNLSDWTCKELFKGTLPEDPFQQYLQTNDPQILADWYNKDPDKAIELFDKIYNLVKIIEIPAGKTVAGIQTKCFKFNYKQGFQSEGNPVEILRCYHPQAGLLMFEQEVGSEYYKEVKKINFGIMQDEQLFKLPAEPTK